MQMKISLLHPSRSRVVKSVANHERWIRKAGNVEVETIVSVDFDDPQKDKYITAYAGHVYDNRNNSVVQATNFAAHVSKGDILVYLSDDFDCPENWGELVLKEFEGETKPMLLKVDDCLQNFHIPVLTIPIMNRALYEKLGYFWHPGYKSMFVDEDLYWTCKKLGAIKNAEHLKFPHEHVSIGKSEDDETYRNSAKNWNQGKAFFEKRKRSGFQL